MAASSSYITSYITGHIEALKQHHVAVPDVDKAEHYFLKIGGNRLTRYAQSYLDGLLTGKGESSPDAGIEFDHILGLYKFDRNLRLHSLDGIERIEVSIKSEIDCHLSDQFGADWFETSAIEIPADLRAAAKRSRDRASARRRAGANQSRIVDELTFGQMVRLYQCIPNEMKAMISRNHCGLKWPVFQSCIRSMTVVRNMAAHHEKLWDERIDTHPKVPQAITQQFGDILPLSDYPTKYFAQASIIYFLLMNIARNTRWHKRLWKQLQTWRELPAISIEFQMGFPENWNDMPFWNQQTPIAG